MEERLGGAKTRWCGCKYWSLEPLYTLHLHWVPETRKCTGLHPGLWKSSRILTLWGLSRWWLTQMFQYILIESWTEQRRHIASGRDKVYLTRPSWPNAYLGPEPTKYWKNKYMWIYLTSIAKPRQTTMDKYSDILFHWPAGCHYGSFSCTFVRTALYYLSLLPLSMVNLLVVVISQLTTFTAPIDIAKLRHCSQKL